MKLSDLVPLIAIFVAFHPCIVVAYETKSIDTPGSISKLKLNKTVGPESVEFDPSGLGPYTGVSNGRILKWQGNWTDFAYNSMYRDRDCVENRNESKCGRPLGLRFNDVTGNLYVADAYLGLLSVGPKGGLVDVLATEAEGVPFKFLNGLDVDQLTGDVYFTDSSDHIVRSDYLLVVLSNDTTGRLLKYNPQSKELTVLKSNLMFPNGVVVSHDKSHLLVCSTTLCQINKYWIRGPKTGTFELFVDLPGYPDNITRDPRGGYWVAMSNLKGGDLAGAAPEHPVAFRLDQDGNILEALNGGVTTYISEVHEKNGLLWIGSVSNPYVGICSA
ncbi:Strictosidine synthase [Rhynchospora pubera]|uniref:Strictosidine synthase n=1 Tax=Rhynchospora pubera TaxID=906938 RepID=A0AAV8BYH2_9POAL|nr:Strictosidine synthase [Rhynchospora pubera]